MPAMIRYLDHWATAAPTMSMRPTVYAYCALCFPRPVRSPCSVGERSARLLTSEGCRFHSGVRRATWGSILLLD
ncbi:hypothetical protein TNCV_3638051 [Trichonephila clavipes]|nr:hypothetical protein TNCV_3638051 [Trichonephila clavipes]